MSDEMIRCASSACNKLRSVDQFVNKQTGKRTKLCEQCREYHRRSMKNSKPKWWARRQAYNRKTLYGLSQEEYERLLEAQKGVCAICSRPPEDHATYKVLAVDHSKEGVRGLLCSQCNVGIGMFNHDPEVLQKAIKYLGFRDKADM